MNNLLRNGHKSTKYTAILSSFLENQALAEVLFSSFICPGMERRYPLPRNNNDHHLGSFDGASAPGQMAGDRIPSRFREEVCSSLNPVGVRGEVGLMVVVVTVVAALMGGYVQCQRRNPDGKAW